jgi:hypothetical protein
VVLAVRSVIFAVNSPVPVPSKVFELLIVGFCEVCQHTPRAVIDVLTSTVIKPPLLADVVEISVTLVVVIEIFTVGLMFSEVFEQLQKT